MSEFTKAAERAAGEVGKNCQETLTGILNSCQELGLIDDGYEFEDATVMKNGDLIDIITKHFADLAATYELLVELAKIVDNEYVINKARVRGILNDERIQRAIGGTE